MKREDTDGCHLMCFTCGLFACEACKSTMASPVCPDCGVDQEALQSRGGQGRALLDLVAAKPTGRHLGKACFWLGDFYHKGGQGAGP